MLASSPLVELIGRLDSRTALASQDRAALATLPSQVLQVGAGREFAGLAEGARHVWLVVGGMIARYAETGAGERQVTALYVPGELAGLEAFFHPSGGTRLQALTVSTLLAIPIAALAEAARRHAAIAEALAHEHIVQGAITSEWLVNIGRRKSVPRTAHLFCELAMRHGRIDGGPRLSFPFPARQGHLAEMLALTAVHMNRTLKALREEGLLSFHDRDATIHDWDRLARLGDFDRAYLGCAAAPDMRVLVTG